MSLTNTKDQNLGMETMKILYTSYNAQSKLGPCVYVADYKLRSFIVGSESIAWSIIHAFQRILGYIIILITLYFSDVHIYVLPSHGISISYALGLAMLNISLFLTMSVAVDLTYWKLGASLASYANAYIKFIDHLYDAYNVTKEEKDLDIEAGRRLERILRCISVVTVILIIILGLIAPVPYLQELWLVYKYAVKEPIEIVRGTRSPIWLTVTVVCCFVVPGYWFMLLQNLTRLCAGAQFMFVFAFQTTRVMSRIHMKVSSKLDNVENGIKSYEFGSNGPILERMLAGFVFLVDASLVSGLTVICGDLESDSMKLLQEFKVAINHNLGMSDLKLLCKTLKPMYKRVQAGQAYYLHKISVVEFWDNVIDKTVFLLCAIPLHN